MRRIVVFMSLTLDGVIQAPGRSDEDSRGGFGHGGWALPYADPEMGKAAGESWATPGGLLCGGGTYGAFFFVGPKQTDTTPLTEIHNTPQKFAAPGPLRPPLPWMNSTLLEGDAVDAVARLKQQPGKDIVVLGSGELVQSLMRGCLVDQYVLLIHPLILGSGRRLFNDGDSRAALQLFDSKTTSTGVLIATYRPAVMSSSNAQ